MSQGMKALVLGLALSAPFAVAGNGATTEHIEAATAGYKQLAKGLISR